MAVFLFHKKEEMNVKYNKWSYSFNQDNLKKMMSEPNDLGVVRMLSISPQTGVKMIYEYDPELEEIFGDDTETIFSLRAQKLYLRGPASDLIHVGKRVYLMGTGVAYKLNSEDDYEDMNSDEMADACLELFGRMQRVFVSGFCFPVIDLTEDEESEKKK